MFGVRFAIDKKAGDIVTPLTLCVEVSFRGQVIVYGGFTSDL
jgi:hypothetical protein